MKRSKKKSQQSERPSRSQFPVSESSEYSQQPDSGSRIGGHRGEEEYGLAGELVRDSSHSAFRDAHTPQSDSELELAAEPLPYGELTAGFPGVSEWTAEHAGLEEIEEEKEVLPSRWEAKVIRETQT